MQLQVGLGGPLARRWSRLQRPHAAAALAAMTFGLLSGDALAEAPFLGPRATAVMAPALPPPDPLDWHYPKARVGDYLVVAGFATATALVQLVPVVDRHWERNAVDESFRSALRVKSDSARKTVGMASDMFWFGTMLFPFVETIFLVGPRNDRTAWQLFIIDAEATTVAGFETQIVERFSGRARPFVRECAKNPAYEADCSDNTTRYESFVSGHTLMAGAGAGLTCANHLQMPIYGGGAGDVIICATMVAAVVGEGTLRMAADRHYFTDVASAGLLGFATGYAMPRLMRYDRERPPQTATFVLPYVTTTQGGVVAGGRF